MKQTPSFDAFRYFKSPFGGAPALAMTRIESNARLRFAVAQALAQGRVRFHFQAVVRADRPDFVAFHEMLARIHLPSGQILPAGAFMPAIEEGELGRAIDRLALRQALRVLAENPGLRLSVNMSPRSMGDEEWLSVLAAAHRGGSGVCGRLIIEITEDAALADAGQTLDFMDHVRRSGAAFALDDFGAGATGFGHFRRFRFDIVKIDGAFVQGVHSCRDHQVLVECLMTLSRHFEMFTVAERVETGADAAWLRAAGVDCLQGYLYGRPAIAPTRPGEDDAPLRAIAG